MAAPAFNTAGMAQVPYTSYPREVSSPLDGTEATPPEQKDGIHRRGYQACQPCRMRKVKCDLGNPDNPNDPPCARCRREHKECVFSDTRRKRKSSSDSIPIERDIKRHLTSVPPAAPSAQYQTTQLYSSPQPSSTSPQWHPLPPQMSFTSQPRLPQHTLPNGLPDNLNGGGVHIRSDVAAGALLAAADTSQDSLKLLAGAADSIAGDRQSVSEGLRSPSVLFGSPASGSGSHARGFLNNMTPGHPGFLAPSLAGDGFADEAIQSALTAWSRMRFVRAGWFTASEAMRYVEYYYERLAPMTPIVIPDFQAPAKHLTLLTEEPILAITILSITSRHMRLSGPGAMSRAYQIHEKLWSYLRCMVERLLWGQEQFGGGFTGGGASARVRESHGGQITWKGSLRTLGTIEAILLLTDWHPRALHFPPGDDENRLLDADYNLLADAIGSKPPGNDFGNETLPYASWLEPAWRSDRMSWMLLGIAQALSFELGVFDKNHYNCKNEHGPASDCARKRRVRRLVLVYVSQNSGRLGIPSMLDVSRWEFDKIFETTSQEQRKGRPEDPIDVMQNCWLGIASIMYKANQEIFPSRQFTRDLTSNGKYKAAIAPFKPLLLQWKTNFDKVSSQIPDLMRHILIMEYEYARCYINSLGLQKVVESWVEFSKQVDQSMLMKIYTPNKVYIDEVADSAYNILRAVVDGLALNGYLHDAPVRVYFRALSGMMFTLKRFGLGAFEHDVRQALELLDRATDAMLASVVDDVHLGTQTANQVKMISANIQKTFLRIQAPTSGSEAPSHETSRHHTPHHQENAQDQIASSQRRRATSSSNAATRYRSDPLHGIQGVQMNDLSSHTFMPPHFGSQDAGMATDSQLNSENTDLMSDPITWPADWLTLPIDNFLNQQNSGVVDQGFGGIGPIVGNLDMLEVFTGDQYNQWQGQNMPPGAPFP